MGGGGETVKRNDIKKEILRFKKRDKRRAHPFFKFSRNAQALCLKQKKHARVCVSFFLDYL